MARVLGSRKAVEEPVGHPVGLGHHQGIGIQPPCSSSPTGLWRASALPDTPTLLHSVALGAPRSTTPHRTPHPHSLLWRRQAVVQTSGGWHAAPLHHEACTSQTPKPSNPASFIVSSGDAKPPSRRAAAGTQSLSASKPAPRSPTPRRIQHPHSLLWRRQAAVQASGGWHAAPLHPDACTSEPGRVHSVTHTPPPTPAAPRA